MKVKSSMIICGSLVMHTLLGLKGVVCEVDGDLRLVHQFDTGTKVWRRVDELEWTDAVAKPVDRRATVSKVMFNRPENDLLNRWCELAAANGGAFAINQEWSANQWWTTYTIEWPDGIRIPEGA